MSDTAEVQTSNMLQMQVPLIQLHAYLSDGCSLGCRHCANGAAAGKGTRFLPLDLFVKAVGEAMPLGLQSVRLSGTQVLGHPELEAMLDEIQRRGLNLALEASGEGMTPKLARRLGRMPSVSVSVGLDGADAETHDRLNGIPGQFDEAVNTLKLLSKAGLSPEILFNLKRSNAAQLPDIIRLAEKLRAGSVHFILPQPVLEPDGASADNLEVAELIALSRKVERQLETKTQLKLWFGAPPVFRGLHPMARIEGQGRCSPLNSLALLATGQYALCGIGQRLPELIFGHAGQVALEAIWRDHPLLKTLRDGMPEKMSGICEHCIMKTACLGNCVAENYVQTGSFFGPYWFCQKAAQSGLFPAGRVLENIW